MSTPSTLVVLGSGPGIGAHVAALFASRHFTHTILLSRNAQRLASDISFVRAAAPGATIASVVADVGNKTSLENAFVEIDRLVREQGSRLEVVLYNAARVGASALLKFPVEDVERDLAIAVSGLYTTAAWAVPQFLAHSARDSSSSSSSPSGSQQKYKPSLLVTAGLLQLEPIAGLFSLSLAKTAQHNLLYSLYKEYSKQGVHCGMVCVGGIVSPESKETNPAHIAERFWELYAQDAGEWTREIVLEEPGYWDMVRGS